MIGGEYQQAYQGGRAGYQPEEGIRRSLIEQTEKRNDDTGKQTKEIHQVENP